MTTSPFPVGCQSRLCNGAGSHWGCGLTSAWNRPPSAAAHAPIRYAAEDGRTQEGWAGLQNGELLRAAANRGIEVAVSADPAFRYAD